MPIMFTKLPFRGYFYFAIALNVVTLIFTFLSQSFLPPIVPLFYGLPSGVGVLVPSIALAVAPGISLLITALNIFLSYRFSDMFIKKTLSVASGLLAILSTITIIKIVFLVGF